MKRKWWLAVAALVVLAALMAIGILLFLPPKPGITYGNYSRLEKGMSHQQVTQLLGEPTDPPIFYGRLWENENDIIWVTYDEAGLVRSASWNGREDDRTALGKLRDRFPLLARDPPRTLVSR
jgi:hypothetical protein